MSDLLGVTFFVVVAVIFSVLIYNAQSTCSDKGGTLVRGVTWYICIGGK